MDYRLQIQKGRYRGRKIPAPGEIKGRQNATPSIVKEALFQLLETAAPQEAGFAFFDLCAGSGQIGFEAASRGYEPVHINEADPVRFRSLITFVKQENFDVTLHKKDFRRAAPLICSVERAAVFLDPPYSFWSNGSCAELVQFLHSLEDSMENTQNVCAVEDIIFAVQGPDPLSFQGKWIKPVLERRYGKNWITILSCKKGLSA